MEGLRYNRTFKKGLATIIFCILLFTFVVVFFVISKIQYDDLISEMNSLEATIVDVNWNRHVRGPDEQEIYIKYDVEGVTYTRKLETNTAISFSAGRGAKYSVGDKIEIYYSPQNPEIIATPRSVGVGAFYAIVCFLGLALVLFALFCLMKHHRDYLVTQEEYEKEKEERKNSKSKKKKARFNSTKEQNSKTRKIGKVVFIILGIIVGIFILYVLLGALLITLGY